MNLEENEYKDNFTKEGEKSNLNINKLEVDCITSNKQNFSLDEEGNLKVTSITTIDPFIGMLYPFEAIYLSMSSVNPKEYFGGSWEQIKERFLFGCGENYRNGTLGGEKEHRLKQQECGIREHTHQLPLSTKSGVGSYDDLPFRAVVNGNPDLKFRTGRITGISDFPNDYNAPLLEGNSDTDALLPHNNMPPYLAVFIWKRVA